MKSVCVAGGTGFIGDHLLPRLQEEGFSVDRLLREDFENDALGDKIGNASIVINVAGESIVGLWTKKKRKRIYDSRVLTARKLVEVINQSGKRVELVIQVSGVAVYDRQHVHTEESLRYDDGFLSQVIHDWEGELDNIRDANIRVVILRLGIVLDKAGGMLQKMMLPLKRRLVIGVRSDEYFPFVQMEDLMDIFIFSLNNLHISGVVNVSAPRLTKINLFFEVLNRLGKGKFIIWINRHIIRLLMGESGSLITNGQQVVPAKLMQEGFVFRYDNIEDALKRACN